MLDLKLKVNEIFKSIQGESTYAGIPCTFIRLTGCPLRCSYCDTKYAYKYGRYLTISDILNKIKNLNTQLIELTGGEPLAQPNVYVLIDEIIKLQRKNSNISDINSNYLLIETSGSISIKNVNKEAIIIMDIKTPSSNCSHLMDFNNISYLKPNDEVKFVIGTKKDYEYAKKVIETYNLYQKCKILISAVYNMIDPSKIVKWILKDELKVRFQLQLHKYIWDPNKKGV